ncbi:MAG: M28 family peptidase, partial [Candidatus Bathyarchaeota archaeon]|nr:M28 family peptidase [Candidatus Bathyarchaeota archaeon]
ANDNAAGVGLAIEVAKVIQEAIESGRIDRPKRTITFIIGAEMYGSLSYLERNWGRRNEIVGGFCLDMLGEDQEKTKAGVEVSSVPDSLPTFLNDHVATLFEWVRRDALYQWNNANRCYKYDSLTVNFRYNMSQFTPGSDHLIFDDSSVGIPVIQFGHWPDIYYHSSGDKIEMVDPEELKRNGLAFGTALLNLADAGAEQAATFMNHVYTQSVKRLADNGGRARDEAGAIHEDWKSGGADEEELAESIGGLVELELKRLEFLAERDREGLRSALRLTKTDPEETQQGLKTLAESLERSIGESLRREEEALKEFASSLLRGEGLELELKARVAEKMEYGRLVPKRSFVGSLSGGDFMRKLGPERRREYAEWAKKAGKELVFGNMNAKIVEMWSFADGKRSITEIMEAVTFEYGPTDPELVHEIFKDLERIGYVELTSG